MKTLIQQTEQRSRGIKRAHCFPEAGRIFSVPQGPMCLEFSLTKVNARQPRKKEDLYGPSLMSTRTPELWILLMLETGHHSAHLPESHKAKIGASLVAHLVKKSACNAVHPGSIPGLGRSPREGIGCPRQYLWASLVARMVKNLSAMWEIWVRSQIDLGWEDPLEEGMATHSSILAWRIPLDRGAWWTTVHRVTKSQAWLSN